MHVSFLYIYYKSHAFIYSIMLGLGKKLCNIPSYARIMQSLHNYVMETWKNNMHIFEVFFRIEQCSKFACQAKSYSEFYNVLIKRYSTWRTLKRCEESSFFSLLDHILTFSCKCKLKKRNVCLKKRETQNYYNIVTT